MKSLSETPKIPLLVAAVAIIIASSGGAVAGGMITGKQIKDNTVTTKDIKNKTLTVADFAPATKKKLKGAKGRQGAKGADGTDGTDGVSGYEYLERHEAVSANTPTDISLSCSEGKVALGISAYWLISSEAVQTVLLSDRGSAFTVGIPAADTLKVTLTCATVADQALFRGSFSGKR